MKKMLAAALAASMVMGLTACGEAVNWRSLFRSLSGRLLTG